jgi:hypothetical protein
MIDLICSTCQKPFKRKDWLHKKNLERGTKKYYCSVRCNPRSSPDELSSFRYLMNNVKNGRAKLIDIDEKYLKELFDKQKGLCAITKIPMKLKFNSNKGKKTPIQCSVDRIDNSKDYSKDNVRLTCLIANISRNVFSDEDVLKFCKDVSKGLLTDWELIDSLLDRGYLISRKEK